MPRKNKEEYNEYMRNYMKKKNRELSGSPVLDDDFDPSSSGKPVLDIGKTGKLIEETKNLLKSKNTDSEDEADPILKAIDKYGKYLPIAVQFIQGIAGAIPKQKQQNQIQAPEGWLYMTPLQKLGMKHTRSEWYAQGEAYDNFISTGNINPAINASYVDPTYGQPAPQNLQSLARKYPEAPLVKDNTPTQTPNSDGTDAPQESPTVLLEEAKTSSKEKTGVEAEKQSTPAAVTKEDPLIAELQADNLKYINLGSDYVNNLKDKEFLDHLKNIEGLVEKAKPLIPLIPIQVKGMIVQTSEKDLEDLFKEKCPKKYKVIVKQKKVKKLLELFEELKKLIS